MPSALAQTSGIPPVRRPMLPFPGGLGTAPIRHPTGFVGLNHQKSPGEQAQGPGSVSTPHRCSINRSALILEQKDCHVSTPHRFSVDILPGLKSGASTSLTSLRPLGIEPNGRRSRWFPPLKRRVLANRLPG